MLLFAAIAYENSEIEEQRLDEQLFARIGQGDKSAFCQLYEETSNVVFAYALSFLRNKEDAEDVMQETFCIFGQQLIYISRWENRWLGF